MPIVSEYVLGAPCWFELGTTEQSAAKTFYAGVFGWEIADFPIGPDELYTMFKLGGHDVGAAYTLPQKLRDQGVPPHWGVYFATPNVDDTTEKAKSLGATIVQPPFDVMDVGRMSIVRDPGGAVFSLWQRRNHFGAGVIGQDNSVCWSELASWDVPGARAFYAELFNWETKGAESMASYIEFSVAGAPSGGLLPMDENWKGVPSHWGIYFMVADCDATVAKAKELGAQVKHGPFDAPGVGRMAMLDDPQGAGFSIIKLASPA